MDGTANATANATAGADAGAVAVGQGLDRLRPLKTLGEAGVIRFGTRVLHMKYKDKEWWIDVRADGILLVHGGDGTECVYAIFNSHALYSRAHSRALYSRARCHAQFYQFLPILIFFLHQ